MARGVLVFVATAAAFVAGVAVGLTLGSTDVAAPVKTTETAPLESASATQSDAEPATEAHQGGATRTRESTRSAAAPPQETVAAVDPPPAGDGVITGSILTADGTPVAGLEVSAVPTSPPESFPRGDAGELSIEERVRLYERMLRWNEAAKRTSRSGEDGRYELNGLGNVAYRIGVVSDTYRVQPVDHRSSREARSGQVVNFEAVLRTGLVLDVRLPDGSAPAEANVRFEQRNSSVGTGWRASRPRVDVAAGAWKLTVTAGEFSEFSSDGIDVAVGGATPETPLIVQLAARRGIVLDVVAAEGFGSVGVRTEVTGKDGRVVKAEDNHGWDRGWPAPGVRTYFDLPAGAYEVSATHDGTSRSTAVAQVAEGLTRLRVQAPRPAAERLVTVLVTGLPESLASKPAFGWRVTGSNSEASYAARSMRSDANIWTVVRPAETDRPSSSSRSGADVEGSQHAYLTLSLDNVPRGEVEVPAGRQNVEISVMEPMTIDVVVDGADGRDLKVSAWIVKRSEHGMSSRGAGSTDVDAKGRARLGPLEPRTYEVTLTAGSRGGPSVELARVVVEAQRGTKEIHIPLPALYRVDVDLGAARSTESITFWRRDEDQQRRSYVHLTLDAAGRGVLDALIAGTWEYQIDGTTRTFTVPGTTVVTE